MIQTAGEGDQRFDQVNSDEDFDAEGIELIEETVIYNEPESNVMINFETPMQASQPESQLEIVEERPSEQIFELPIDDEI